MTVATALVFLMQGGFLLLEAGMVRSTNSINVAQKNLRDFVRASCGFYLFGFAVIVGPGGSALIGLSAVVLVTLSVNVIERVLKLDDVVGAESVHAVCGSPRKPMTKLDCWLKR